MALSRRRFLRDAACLPLAVAATKAEDAGLLTASRGKRCLVLNSSCIFRESLEGYKASLSAAGMVCDVGSSGDCPFIVAPAASLLNFDEVRWLRRRAETGACVLVESGGMFLSAAEFRRQQSLAQAEFGLNLLPPVKLWQALDSGIPYVDFIWPIPARVRDFSRAIPLRGAGVPAAHLEGKTVALKCHLGAGTLVFLGSPLGPHLLSGDREAQLWLVSFAAQEPG